VAILLGLASNPAALREVANWQSKWPRFAVILYNRLARLLPDLVAVNPAEAVAAATPTPTQITDWILGNLGGANDGGSLTIYVSFTSESPERAAAIANQVAQTYLDNQVLAKTRATMRASEWLGDRVEKIRQQLEASEAAVDDYRRKAGLLQVKGGTIPAE